MTTALPTTETNGEAGARPSRLRVEEDPGRWALAAAEAREAARMRRTFRAYLEHYGHPASDFDAAEAVYGELVNTCVDHAPGEVKVEFTWHDATLVVVDTAERLRSWPFSADDPSAETTHHAYALISAFTGRIHLTRDPACGGTRASVALPVMRRTS
jgi:hypothetical protein